MVHATSLMPVFLIGVVIFHIGSDVALAVRLSRGILSHICLKVSIRAENCWPAFGMGFFFGLWIVPSSRRAYGASTNNCWS